MRVSPKVTRRFVYGLLIAGILFLIYSLSANTVTALDNALPFNPIWLGGLCCVIPLVLAGLALRNESQ